MGLRSGQLAAAALLLLLMLVPRAEAQQVRVKGTVTVAVDEDPSGGRDKWFVSRGLRLHELRLTPRERRRLEPNQRITVRGRLVDSTIDVTRMRLTRPLAPRAVTGSRSVLVLRTFWGTQDGVTPQIAADQVAGTDDDFYRENSYNRMGLTVSVTPWLQIPQPDDCDDIGAINEDVQDAALAAGINTAPFDHNMIYISSADCIGRSWGLIGGRITWIQGKLNTYRTAHELGHNFGLRHASSKRCRTASGTPVPLSDSCTVDEYGDRFDVMGAFPTDENGPSHLSAPQKDALGWLAGRSLTTKRGTHTLRPLEGGSFALHAVKIVTGGRTLWLEYRQPTGFDAPLGAFPGMTRGVVIHQPAGDTGSLLLDMTPRSLLDFDDTALPVGGIWTDPSGDVTIVVRSAGPFGATVTLESPCQRIAREITQNEADIRALQAELQTAPPAQKPALVREIRALQAENRRLAAEADRRGC